MLLTHEEVIGVWVGPSNLEQLHKIVKLTMYISTDCDGTFLPFELASVRLS